IGYRDVTAELLSESDIIINTTPLGMFPSADTRPEIDYDCLEQRHILFDLVYNPETTAFMKEGIRRGCHVIGGLAMLYAQAERAWEIWNDESL
nr:shikimate dehydrogenase [Bacteroidales bacterium]